MSMCRNHRYIWKQNFWPVNNKEVVITILPAMKSMYKTRFRSVKCKNQNQATPLLEIDLRLPFLLQTLGLGIISYASPSLENRFPSMSPLSDTTHCQQRHQLHIENIYDCKANYLQLVLKMQKVPISQLSDPFYALPWAAHALSSIPANMQMHKMGWSTSFSYVSAIL